MDDIKLAAEGNKGLVAVRQCDVLHRELSQKRCYMETKPHKSPPWARRYTIF